MCVKWHRKSRFLFPMPTLGTGQGRLYKYATFRTSQRVSRYEPNKAHHHRPDKLATSQAINDIPGSRYILRLACGPGSLVGVVRGFGVCQLLLAIKTYCGFI